MLCKGSHDIVERIKSIMSNKHANERQKGFAWVYQE